MPKKTISTFRKLKRQGEKFASFTAYDSTFARVSEEAGVDCFLVGDSLGNVIQGQQSTVPVSVEAMCYHTECVSRGIQDGFLMSDMPFLSYTTSEQAMTNAALLMQAGAEMVKMEGTSWLEETVYTMSQRGIPVCAHLGLLPQSVAKMGGYRIQGTESESANAILNDAICLEKAGADMILLECVPAALATKVTKAVTVPVIGIGAGGGTDSQILVAYDAFGISKRLPSFSKNYFEEATDIKSAIQRYVKEVKNGSFPDKQYTIK